MLSKPRFLTHFTPDQTLFLNLNASNKCGFSVMVFHLAPIYTLPDVAKLSADKMQPIMFMSKLCSPAEKRYYSTELEVACLVWACRKLRPMI
jgi:hypothetical protein